jgi:uncharacterized membrane protein YfcA
MWSELFTFILIGFAAQLVDGAIGMAYGLVSTSTLLSVGIAPATASASVHAAEVFTTGASGLSHWRLKNIDWRLVRRLAPAGMAGGFLGAYILATNASQLLSLIVGLYLIVMGAVVFKKGLQRFKANPNPPKHIPIIGFFGGMLDAIGGGGWGPLVTTNLLGQGTQPRLAIGSTSLSEFFVTFTISVTFMATIGLELWPIITGLVIGGVLAAPIAAFAARFVPARVIMLIVGAVIMALSLRTVIINGSGLLWS